MGTCDESIGALGLRHQKCGGNAGGLRGPAGIPARIPKSAFPVPSFEFTAMAANTLPARNEEYGTREYWCALIYSFVMFCQTVPYLRDRRYAQ